MMNCKKLSLGLVVATILATPVMAQGGKQELGAPGVHQELTVPHRRPRCESDARSGYYYGNRFHPAPRVGAFAAAPRNDGPYGSLASLSANGDAL